MDEQGTETLIVEDRTDWSPRARWGMDRRWAAVLLVVAGAFAALLATVRPPRQRARAHVARTVHYVVCAGSAPGCSSIPRW